LLDHAEDLREVLEGRLELLEAAATKVVRMWRDSCRHLPGSRFDKAVDGLAQVVVGETAKGEGER
jgi:hypothetical protein